MITRNEVISIVLLFALLLMGCTKQNTVQPAQVEQNPGLTQISVMTEMVPPKPTSTKPEIQSAEAVLNEFTLYEESFTQAINTTHWIQQISKKTTFDNQTQTYRRWDIVEEWYRFDEDGRVIEFFTWVRSPDGVIEQESCLVDGRLYNVTMQSSGLSEPAAFIDFTGGFAEGSQTGKNLEQEHVAYQGIEAEKFSYETKEGVFEFVHTIYFDSATHYILGKETLLKELDGSEKIVSNMVITTFIVDADPPLEHFQQILSQVPE